MASPKAATTSISPSTARDLDVTIKPKDGGFDIAWTTITHGTTRGQRIVRKSETVAFVATERPNVFRAATPVEPLSGTPYYWARIAGRTLTVYALLIGANGAYELTSWTRTLNPNGMDLIVPPPERRRSGANRARQAGQGCAIDLCYYL